MAQENKNNQDDFAANLFQQITNISKASAYDILLEQHKKLEERNKVLEDALKGIVNSWDKNMRGEREEFKQSNLGSYWSPSQAMVRSETIAKAREALSNNQK